MSLNQLYLSRFKETDYLVCIRECFENDLENGDTLNFPSI